MFFDARKDAAPTDRYYDICVVGAGAAGIAIGVEFALRKKRRVCILEGGDLDYTDNSQELYQGEIVGRDYEDLDTCRLRYFGGTTNHWAGYCLPFSDYSFEKRAWIPYSGWPISRSDVAPYYERARSLLGLPDGAGWDPGKGWDPETLSRHHGSPILEQTFEHFRHNVLMLQPVRMGEVFRDVLRDAENVDVFLNANAVEIETNNLGETATGITVMPTQDRSMRFSARHYVLAAGGLENARLLLSSTAVQSEGVGNRNGLVGRFFADHINIEPARLLPANRGLDIDLYQRREFNAQAESVLWHELTLSAQQSFELIPCSVRMMQQRERLRGPSAQSLRDLRADIENRQVPTEMGRHLMNVLSDLEPIGRHVAEYLWHGERPIKYVGYEMSLAPAPNPESKVTLGEKIDRFGMRRIKLDWQLSEIDFRTIKWAAQSFADQAAAFGIGRSVLQTDDESLAENVRWTHHHMCTTRMSSTPSEGVVDSDCRIHGMTNLYVAGSSVFSTAGWGSPTFLIVGLAQRLGDHLESRMAK